MTQPINSCADPTALYRQTSKASAADAEHASVLAHLDERLRFESWLARLSTTFINLPVEEIDSQIERGLQQIVEFLGVDRSSLGQFSGDGGQLVITHSYVAMRFAGFPRVDVAPMMPWYTAQFRKGKIVRFSRLPDELPPEATREREFCLQSGFRAHLLIPFKVGESILGGLGFGSFTRQREWPDELVQSLQLVGEIFANALARKRADLALRASEERFRLMAESAPVMVWMTGRDKLCTYCNQDWLDFTGQPLESQVGNGWSEGVHRDDLQRCLDTYCQAFDARQRFRMEYRLRRFDGEYRWIVDTGAPRFESDGTFEGYIGSCIDITDQREAAEESRSLHEQIAHVGRVSMMGELTASIAHEVNQPLCAIVSNAQALQRMVGAGNLDKEETLAALRDIMRDGQRASAVIARIRGFLQKAPVQRSQLDVNELIREVAALLQGEMIARGIAVKLALADKLPPVQGDRIQLQQVILNLMANAADAMDQVPPDGRELHLDSRMDNGGSVAVAVTDAGMGLAPEKRGRVFDPFFTTKSGSLGMGLAICKSLVEAHGGTIAASPGAASGTTFCFTLPAAGETAP
jgi:two-component system, LuxR family, sensor kinase FixL